MIDLSMIVGMTPEERRRHLGPQSRKPRTPAAKGKESVTAPSVNWSRVFAWAVFVVLLILCLRGVQ